MSFTVAIIGRPNVGKSTLFNRLVGRRIAIVHDQPGVTRDRRAMPASLLGLEFTAIDTAGLEEADPASLEGRMRRQTETALAEADVALFLFDARAGVTPMDEHFAAVLRRQKTPVILVANKCEGRAAEAGLGEAWALGLGEPVGISAEHNLGFGDLLAALEPYAAELGALPAQRAAAEAAEAAEAWDDEAWAAIEDSAAADADALLPADEPAAARDARPPRPLQLAIVGRPNTGKSTLVNALVGDDRMLTGPEAGVTRDAIPVDWSWQGRPVRLVDTAGLRRRTKVEQGVERLSAANTLEAIRMAEVVVLVLDGNAILEKQDLTIARLVVEEGRALVIAVNKWDAVRDRKEALKILSDKVEASLAQVKGIPTVTLSGLRGQGLDRLMEAVFAVHAAWNIRIPTARLNRWLADMIGRHAPPLSKQKRRIKLRYMTQVKARPPTFAIFVSVPDELPESYMRFLVNGLRDDFGMVGVPLRIYLRKPRNPYVDD